MNPRRALVGAVLAALIAAPAVAQNPADPIDALLRAQPPAKDVDPEEPDTAAAGGAVEAEPALPTRPQPYTPSAPTLTAPVYLDETGKNPDAPPSPADIAYDSRLRASMASAQGFQGPMEGGWTLSAGSHELYAFQLIDHDGAVEGAWRDLRRAGATGASGFIDAIERGGAEVTLRFAASVAVLHSAGDGRWAGQLTEGGHSEAVSLQRRGR